MPLILEALADSAGELKLETAQVVYPDYSLADHWADGRAATTIKKAGWHVVVLQQGPSSYIWYGLNPTGSRISIGPVSRIVSPHRR